MALNKDRIFKAADKHIRSNRIEKAIGEYETWLKANPKDWNTIRIVGDLYARIGRNDEAIKKYAQVADHYRRDGFNVRAIATHKMVLRLDPQNESAMRNLAELQAEEGLLMEAKSYYQQLLDLYSKRGHKREAADVFRKLAAIDPQDVKIRYKYAEFLNKQGRADEAASEYVGIADQFIGQGLVEEAVKILEQGRSLATHGPALKLKLAQAQSLQGKHAEAVSMLEEVRGASPNDASVLAQLGDAYMAAGRTSDAETAFQKLTESDSGNPEHALRLAELRIGQSKFDEALDRLVPLVDRSVADGEGGKATQLLGKILAKEPHHVKTLLKMAELHTVMKNDSARVAAYDSLCEAYSRTGDYEKAVQVAEQIVELDPEKSQHVDRLNFLRDKLASPAGAAAPRRPPAEAPRVQADHDLPELTEIEEISLEEEVSESPGASGVSASAPASVDFGDVVELTEEDEENIKEKLTEAEVFVRYGLVDKAIAQLVDVLESFRFHTESREKLIEIYKDQSMTREAAEQLVHLAQVREKLGQAEAAGAAMEEAAQLDPGLASRARAGAAGSEDEIELSLAPDSDAESPLDDVGIELDLGDSLDEGVGVADDAIDEEIPLGLDELAVDAGEPSEEAPQEMDLSFGDADADANDIEIDVGGGEDDLSFEVDLGESPDASQPDVAVTSDDVDDLPGLEEIAASMGTEALGEDVDDGEIAIDLDAGEDVAFAVDDADELVGVETPEPPISGLGAGGEAEPSPAEDAFPSLEEAAGIGEGTLDVPLAEDDEPDEGFSVEIDDDDEIAVDLPSGEYAAEESEEELVVPSFKEAVDQAEEDIEIDIPAAAGVNLDAEAPWSVAGEPEREAETTAPPSASVPASAESSAPAFDPAPREREAPPASAPASAPAAESPLHAELAEVDEYIAVGLYEDARDTLRDLLTQHPGDSSILAKIEELGFSREQIQKEAQGPKLVASSLPQLGAPDRAAAASGPASPAPIGGNGKDEAMAGETGRGEAPAMADSSGEDLGLESLVGAVPESGLGGMGGGSSEDSFIDLASELSDDLFGTQSAVAEQEDEEGPLTDPGLDQIFREFRKGVEKQLGTEDYDTRYNLGIAYKEMGLLDEAIAEFQLAAKDPIRGLECCSMLGLCFMEKGMPDIAIKWFAKGLDMPGRRDEEYHGLRYDLAQAYEAAGQTDRALELYMEIFKDNARFRDVKDRVRELQAARK